MITATLSHNASASDKIWVEKKTVLPSPLLQLLNEFPDFSTAHGIKARHRFIEKHDFGIVQNRLGDADPLQHALGKLSQLNLAGVKLNPLQHGGNFRRAFFCRTSESWAQKAKSSRAVR